MTILIAPSALIFMTYEEITDVLKASDRLFEITDYVHVKDLTEDLIVIHRKKIIRGEVLVALPLIASDGNHIIFMFLESEKDKYDLANAYRFN